MCNYNWFFISSVIRFYEYGIQKRMEKILIKAPLKKVENNALQIIDLSQMKEIFLMPFFGMAISIVIIAGECIYQKIKARTGLKSAI